MTRGVAVVVLAVVIAAGLPGAAQAITPCPGAGTAVSPVYRDQGSLESVIVDARGRLYYTNQTAKELRRLDAPGAAPETIAAGLESPGGLAIDDRGRILLGQGTGIPAGVIGNLAPAAKVLRIDPVTKKVETYAEGLQMSNGLVRAADGTVFASSDVGLGIDRIAPDGTVQVRWAGVISANGLAIDRAGRFLYAAQTFQPAAIQRIDLLDASNVVTYATPPPDGIASGPDGMTIDGRDRLVVAANSGGEIWRVDTDRTVCALGAGLTTPSAVAYGHSDRGFSSGRLFSVGFDGVVSEIPAGRVAGADAPPPPADAAAATSAPHRVLFAPARVRVRAGLVRFTPRVTLVRASGARTVLARRVRLPGGRTVRSGRTVSVRVGRARSLRVTFVVRGVRRTRTITLT
jgi:sugar lactone lactonase YvrE